MRRYRQRRLTLAIRLAAGLIVSAPVLAQDEAVELGRGAAEPGSDLRWWL